MSHKKSKQQLLDAVTDRPIIVWGARMTGLGFLRFARKNNLSVLGFIDSDPSLLARQVNGCPVHAPRDIPALQAQHGNIVIVVAVALKEDEIIQRLKEFSFQPNDYINFSDYVDHFYTIDIVGTCNLRCPSCAHGMDYNNPKGTMPLEDFKKITQKMLREVEIVSHVSLYSWGEPLLHPKLDAFIQHLHDFGIAVAVSSNLSFKATKAVEKLAAASPDYLKISVSGFYPEAYDATHVGGDIEVVKDNLYRLRQWLDHYGAATLVDVNYHLYKNNNGKNLIAMRKLCDALQFNLSTTYALVMPLERVLSHCAGHPDPVTAKLSELLLVGIDEGIAATQAFHHQPCRYLTNQVNIDWDRSVLLCCVCFKKPQSVILEDYLQHDLATIAARKLQHPLCDKCQAYGLPAYNLGLNQPEWERIANQKLSTDV